MVSEEFIKLLRPVCVLTFISYVIFAIFGYYHINTAASLMLGACYIMLNFYMIANASENAMYKPPDKAPVYIFAQYMIRYFLTGCVIFFSIKIEFFNPLATIIPMFFPKFIIIWKNATYKKGG